MAADDDNSWRVVCKELSGVLDGSKFITLTRGECIRLGDANDGDENMVTPKAFLDEAGAASDRSNWKRIIEIQDNSQRTRRLQHIIDSGLLSISRSWLEEYPEGSGRKPSKRSRGELSGSDPLSPKARRFKTTAVSVGHAEEFITLQTLLKDLNSALIKRSSYANKEQQTAIRLWRDEIKTLTRLSDVTADEELTIGIAGRTGVGKSSLLNAIIDEPLLLPVSSFKACTSVPIRIRSNSKLENEYHARIDFLTRKEWLDELKSLCEDIASYAVSDKSSPRRRGDSVSKQIHDIAVAKLKAVYGDWAVHRSYEELKSEKTAVTEELLRGDSWKYIKATTSEELGKHLARFTVSLPPRKKQESGARGECWPLVNSVSISIPNCEALPEGVALVDLPGIRDANAARVAVTDDILKSCDVVWIVCQMTRTTDDEAFVGQLDDELQRQLNLDGQTSTVVVICTKTDELSSNDVDREVDYFELEDEVEGKSMREKAMLVARERNKWAADKIKRECLERAKEAACIDGDAEIRDFTTHVFTVSARDYHELARAAGKTHSQDSVGHRLYDNPDDTEIPAVQVYLREAGAAALREKLLRVVTNSQLLSQEAAQSLADKGTKDPEKRKAAQQAFFTYLGDLTESDTREVIAEFRRSVGGRDCLGKLQIKLDEGIKEAVANAKSEVARWAELNTHTYRAVCLRFGEFNGSKAGTLSFNSDLARPIIDTLSKVWEEVYGPTNGMINQLAQAALKKLKDTFAERVHRFRVILSTDIGVSGDRLKPAELRADRLVEDTCRRLNRIVREERKDAHRAVKYAIQLELRPAYDECAEQKGPGTFDRMKSIMSQSTTQGKPQPKVFLQAKDRLMSHCDSVMERVDEQLTNLGKEMRSVHSFQHLWRSPSDAQSTAEIEDIVSKLLEV